MSGFAVRAYANWWLRTTDWRTVVLTPVLGVSGLVLSVRATVDGRPWAALVDAGVMLVAVTMFVAPFAYWTYVSRRQVDTRATRVPWEAK